MFGLGKNRKDAGDRGEAQAILEALEPRLLLSGNVTAVVRGGTLTLTGDNQENHIQIDQAGLTPDQYRISATDGTTSINGVLGTSLIVGGVTKDIRLRFKKGPDAALVTGVYIPGSFLVYGGNGGAAVTIDGQTTIGRDLIFRGGTGDDSLSVSGDSRVGGRLRADYGRGAATTLLDAMSIGKDLVVKTGDGGDVTLQNGSAVGGNVNITNGKGDTTILISGSAIGGKLTVRNKTGTDAFSLVGGSSVDRDVRLDNGSGDTTVVIDASTVARRLTVRNRGGADAFTLSGGAVVASNLRIDNRDGGSTTLIDASTVGGAFTIRNADGDETFTVQNGSNLLHTVRIDNGDGQTATTFDASWTGGHVDVRNGAGVDDLTISGGMVFGSRVRVDNGSDRDVGVGTVTISSAIFVKDLDIRRRYGESSVSIVGSVITGRTSIDAGRDTAVIRLDDSTFIRQVTIRTGAGDDVIDLEANGDPAGEKSTFSDRLTLTTGDGDDTITIGVADETGNSAIFSRGARIDGGRGEDVLDITSNGNYRLLSQTLSYKNIETVL